jgi:hypothetical protein
MDPSQTDFDRLTQGLSTKSDKIRALARHGAATADIARYLDIRYQFARNVLERSGLHRVRTDRDAPPADASGAAANTTSAWVEVDALGRLQIPPKHLAMAGLHPGEMVNVRVSSGALEVLSKRAALQRAQQIVGEFVPPGVSLVDELIAERRREAMSENATYSDGKR